MNEKDISLFNLWSLPASLPFAYMLRWVLYFGQQAVGHAVSVSQQSPPQQKDSSLSLPPAGTEPASKLLTLLSCPLPDIIPKVPGKPPSACQQQCPSNLLERKELLGVEGAGLKDSSFQLISSLVSLDQ